jgi:Lrp/AsnC family transcriptional regulator, leucine-responsive regulatory protein
MVSAVKRIVLDQTDHRIINALVANGRASYASLGAEVGLSAHGVGDRVRRLIRAGVITGFTTGVNLESVGRPLDAMIDVQLAADTTPEEFEARLAKLRPVREFAFTTGRFDYQIRVACADVGDLDRTVRALRQHAGAGHTETRIVLRSSAYRQAVG